MIDPAPEKPGWDLPDFHAKRMHDWRSYISHELREMWHTFTPEQQAAIARNAQAQADAEEWD